MSGHGLLCARRQEGAGADSVDLGVDVAGTTEDRNFSLEVVRCIGACGLAPVFTVDEDIYRRVKPSKTGELLNKYRNGKA